MNCSLPVHREPLDLTDERLIDIARELMLQESREVQAAAGRLNDQIAQAARLVSRCEGRLLVSGLGKSGHVGRKIAATLASLGTPSFFIHAAEAAHGDLGMARPEDVALLISHSGKTAEVLALLPFFRRIGSPIIALTGDENSPLAKEADLWLDASISAEADPLKLAPTSSTTVQLALGDALAAAVATLRGLKSEDFALFHPAGTLGKRLLLRLGDVVNRRSTLPVVQPNATVQDCLFEISGKGYGATTVVENGKLLGIFTDGDLRRLIAKEGLESLLLPVNRVMTTTPQTLPEDELAATALRKMEQKEISVVVVTRGDEPIGLVHLHELLSCGVA